MPHVGRIGQASESGNSTTIVIPVAVAPTVGNHLQVRATFNNQNGVLSVTDSAGNTYQQDGQIIRSGVGSHAVWSARIDNALTTSDTVTITFDGNTANRRVGAIEEFEGWDQTTWFDAVGTNEGDNQAPQVTTVTVAAATELVPVVGWGGPPTLSSFSGDYPTDLGVVRIEAGGSNSWRSNHGAAREVLAQGSYPYACTLSDIAGFFAIQVAYKLADIGPPEVHGSVTISGGGEVATDGHKASSDTAPVSGSGSIIGQDHKAVQDSAAIGGSGSVTASGHKSVSTSTAVSGGGGLILLGRKALAAALAIQGGGQLSLAGRKAARSVVLISGGGAVLVSGSAPDEAGHVTVSISGGGSVSLAGQKAAQAALIITGGGAVQIETSIVTSATGSEEPEPEPTDGWIVEYTEDILVPTEPFITVKVGGQVVAVRNDPRILRRIQD